MAASSAVKEAVCIEPKILEVHSASTKEPISPIFLSEVVIREMFPEEESVSSDANSTDATPWFNNKVHCLIECYREMRSNFDRSEFPKKAAWDMLAERMRSLGYNVNGRQCDKKWRSLKHRYRTVMDRRLRMGSSGTTWSLYAAMESVMEEDPTPSTLITNRSMVDTTVEVPASPSESARTAEAMAASTSTLSSPATPARPEAKEGEIVGWTNTHVFSLIEVYKEFKSQFDCPTGPKQAVWQQVAQKMRARGCNVSADQCYDKWRSLRHRYRILHEKKQRTGINRSRSSWYSAMEELLADNPTGSPPGMANGHFAVASTAGVNPARPAAILVSSPSTPTLYIASSLSAGSASPLTPSPVVTFSRPTASTAMPVSATGRPESAGTRGQKRRRPQTAGHETLADLQRQIAAAVEEQRVANAIQRERNEILRQLTTAIKQSLDAVKR